MSAEGPSAIRSESPDNINDKQSSEHAPPPRSVEAGPSSRSGQRLNLTTSRDSETDNALLEQAIESKRRKSTLLPGIHLHQQGQTQKIKNQARAGGKRKDSIRTGSPEIIRPKPVESRNTGLTVTDISDDSETDEGRAQAEDLARWIKESENAPEPRKEGIVLWTKKSEREDPILWKGFEDELNPNLGYVWDYLFENQRGIYAFGKAHFSPMALLPPDPTPYTVPIEPVQDKSSKIVISNPPQGSTTIDASTSEGNTKISPDTPEHKKPIPRGTINSVYTPETFQLPSPDWEWITPWMINMRDGTDEMGWRYNAWFKMKGWRSKAGTAGWGGWVRRREWVRMRRAIPVDNLDEEDTRGDISEDDWKKKTKKRRSLKKILESGSVSGKEDGDLLEMVKELETVRLDREKLEIWKGWLKDLDLDTKSHLQDLLIDQESCRMLYRQFMYRSTSKQLAVILAENDFALPSTPSTVSKPPSRTSSRDSEDTASYVGYEVETPSDQLFDNKEKAV